MTAAQAAADKLAREIRVWDLRRGSGVADYCVVATCDSTPQIQAVETRVDEWIKSRWGLDPLRREGRAAAAWRVLDYGGLVVHLFTEPSRRFYNLERLWEGARNIPLASASARPSRSARRSRPG